MEAGRRGKYEDAQRMTARALEASQEAEYRISKPYDELRAIRGDVASNPSDYLRHRLKRFEEYCGIQTHEDFRVPFAFLRPAEVPAAQRVFIEASWNAVKHAQARNLWLETRRVGSVVIVRVRDDGRGFDAAEPPPGLAAWTCATCAAAPRRSGPSSTSSPPPVAARPSSSASTTGELL